MIRFVNIKDQIIEGEPEFAFYDTIVDKFKTFSDSQTWSSIADFISDYEGNELERYLNLIPMGMFPYDDTGLNSPYQIIDSLT